MKYLNWQILLGLALIILSAFVYFTHYLIFKDVHHIFIYLIGDITFVFIEVLLVTLIIHRLLSEREKRSMLEKMNMVIGTFFSEAGIELLTSFSRFNVQRIDISKKLALTKNFTTKEFDKVKNYIKTYECTIRTQKKDLQSLKLYLTEKRDFLLRLLENPNLLEHDSFTNLLWAVFHLADELSHRKNLKTIPETDHEHLLGDIKRAYCLLLSEWLDYMRHLKDNYPYLFSLAIRTNPFDAQASAIVM